MKELFSFLSLLFLTFLLVVVEANNVTYDRRSLQINGERKLIISAAIHYPRSVPEMWPGLVRLAKEGGANTIETYVFWDGHEIAPDKYNFDGRWDLVKFVKIVQDAGLYLILRIGPYVAAEWNFGGVPAWLHYVPGTIFRTDNEPFKYYMEKFTAHIVNMMKHEKFFASQGGHIILSQVENEYGTYEEEYGEAGRLYASWAAKMALRQNTGVPWIMCKQWDVPTDVINTCNGFYCDDFHPRHPHMPKMWTENWVGWSVEDIAYSVARFIQKGGSLVNYYMYHGGTNFGRTSGGPFITTSYDYDAPIDEFGLPRLPKWGHLKELHKALKLCENALLNNEPVTLGLGLLQEVDVYGYGSETCAAFISNMDTGDDKIVYFHGKSFHVPAWSVSILPDCKNVVFNTAEVGSQSSLVEMVTLDLKPSGLSPKNDLKWEVFTEKTGIWDDADDVQQGFVDHIDTTKDATDYLWYTTRLHVDSTEEFLKDGRKPMLLIESQGHALHTFVNNVHHGSAAGTDTLSPFTFEVPVTLKAGENEIALLSMTVGLQTASSAFYEFAGAGLTSVKVDGFNNGTWDLSTSKWVYKIGVQGEHLGLHMIDGPYNVNWKPTTVTPKDQPLTWYKAVVDPPPGSDPVALDMVHMGKGQAWLNGELIGRYWTMKTSAFLECDPKCDYRGEYEPAKCSTGCGEPTQRWYHIPRSWFRPSGNVLVVFEETGGDPSQIKFATRRLSGVCIYLSEEYPTIEMYSETKGEDVNHKSSFIMQLECPPKTRISRVKFASFGTPVGTCGSFAIGDCHDPSTASLVEQACWNKTNCSMELTGENFDKDLCPGIRKSLAVEAMCS
ncbi:hypothetical protein AgCh_007540 [Apium graveolens]